MTARDQTRTRDSVGPLGSSGGGLPNGARVGDPGDAGSSAHGGVRCAPATSTRSSRRETTCPGDLHTLLPPRHDVHRVRTPSEESSASIHLLANTPAACDAAPAARTPARRGRFARVTSMPSAAAATGSCDLRSPWHPRRLVMLRDAWGVKLASRRTGRWHDAAHGRWVVMRAKGRLGLWLRRWMGFVAGDPGCCAFDSDFEQEALVARCARDAPFVASGCCAWPIALTNHGFGSSLAQLDSARSAVCPPGGGSSPGPAVCTATRANQVCDLVPIRASPEGTAARLHMCGG